MRSLPGVEPQVKVLNFGLARLSNGFRTHEGGPSAGTLGYHWEQAGEPLRAASAYLEAGLEADKLLDPIGASVCRATPA